VESRSALIALLILNLVFVFCQNAKARRIERIELEAKTMAELTVLMSATDGLHSNLIKQDDEQIDVSLRDIELATKRTMAVSVRLKPHERTHLMKNLEVMDMSVGAARNSGHNDRRERISEIFNTAANLVRVYSVDARFKIFFCARDKMTWIQTKPVGRYPSSDIGERECALRAP
jgi:hypothetical protein